MSWFGKYLASRLLVQAHAQAEDEDIVDPQEVLREKCRLKPKCAAMQEKLETCNARVTSRKQTAETCAKNYMIGSIVLITVYPMIYLSS